MIDTAIGTIEFSYTVNGDDQLTEMYETRVDGEYLGVIDYHDLQEIMEAEGANFAMEISPEAAQEIVEDYFFNC